MTHLIRLRRSISQLGKIFSGAACLFLLIGCTSLREWFHNGLKVGPNFTDPPAPVAAEWIDSNDPHIRSSAIEDDAWWSVFHDATLDNLIETAYRQNLDLKTAATRVFQAQAQKNISVGNLFPQSQNAIGDYAHAQLSSNFNLFNSSASPNIPNLTLPTNLDVWTTGFNMSWEIDFWGRLRRTVESSRADQAGSLEAYRNALVTLLANVATNYVQMRTYQERILFARRNVEIQKDSLQLAITRFKGGLNTNLDVDQAKSTLAQTEATIPPLVIGARQANNQICILTGQPTTNLLTSMVEAPIPSARPEVAVGIPADLLLRRPDIRQARFAAASQCAQIGIAEADFYPRLGVSGFIGYTADDIRHLFEEASFTAYILPNFQWKILNYGRIVNNVRLQDARFQEKILTYQQTVLTAGREVEDGLIGFVQYQQQIKYLEESVRAGESLVKLVLKLYKEGTVDYNRVYTAQSQLVTQQDSLAVARGNAALSLISVYRALGGGWQTFDPAYCKSPELLPAGEAAKIEGAKP